MNTLRCIIFPICVGVCRGGVGEVCREVLGMCVGKVCWEVCRGGALGMGDDVEMWEEDWMQATRSALLSVYLGKSGHLPRSYVFCSLQFGALQS